MPMISSRYCPRCEQYVAAIRNSPNHVLHGIMTLLVCGIWLPVWILCAIGQSYHCPECGKALSSAGDKVVLGILLAFLLLLLLGFVVGFIGLMVSSTNV